MDQLQRINRCLSPWRMPLMLLGLIAWPWLAAAAPPLVAEQSALPWSHMAMQLLGGLAIFLFGLEMMASSLKKVAGDRMRLVLKRLTSNRITGAITGALVTSIVQSSSITTVLVVGFISAGLMNMTQALGVIFGANVGTTITAQIIAFQVTTYAYLMVAIGFLFQSIGRRESCRYYGTMVLGLGLIFLGMASMSDAMVPLRDYPPFLQLMIQMESIWLAVALAALFTALVQSSSATTAIVIVLAGQGFITLSAGIALAFGANVGTCITALLAAIGKPREAVRAAMAHVLFNLLGVMIWIAWIDQLAQFVIQISPVAEGLQGAARLAAETPRQVANAHTLFNVINTLLFLPFTALIARLLMFLLPERSAPQQLEEPRYRPYLEENLLVTPSLAMDAVLRELKGMGMRCGLMLNDSFQISLHGDREALRQFKQRDEEIDLIYEAVMGYLGKISEAGLTRRQTEKMLLLTSAVDSLENIGDVLETSLVRVGKRRLKADVHILPESELFLREVHGVVLEGMQMAVMSLSHCDRDLAERVIALEHTLDERVGNRMATQLVNLSHEDEEAMARYTVERDTLEKFRRIFSFCKALARLVEDLAELDEESKSHREGR
uniref:Putative Na/Pi-cotransporter II-related protein n=1 Tax=Magnetococcus massalia (strain MO-1) TaxID=451514 RepID=A0A1S7LIW2_MAGMO|nr:Putative Na/Pi-cotransporter II-related protein [Candidatus Magnetococcus massalia]